MKIIEAINLVDDLIRNTYSQDNKIKWLSNLDRVAKEVIDAHEGAENVDFNGYNSLTDLNIELLIPEPYDEAYLRWMEAQIHYHNGEYDKYNNAAEAYGTIFEDFKKYYTRTHMPKGKSIKFF